MGEISSSSSRSPSRLNHSKDSICTCTRSGISQTVGIREKERRSIPVLERTVFSPPLLAAATPFGLIVANATVNYSFLHLADGTLNWPWETRQQPAVAVRRSARSLAPTGSLAHRSGRT